MEFWALLLICVVGFTLIAPVIALIRSRRLAEKTQSLEKENGSLREQLRGITTRVRELEKTLEKISRAAPEYSAAEAGPATRSVAETPAVATTSAKLEQQIERPPAAPVSRPTPPATIPPTFPAATPRPSIPPPQEHQPNMMEKTLLEQNKTESRSWADLKERLGANWLNKIGTAAFVIGVALLLNYSMHYLGARERIVLGYALSSVLVATGVFGERTKRYRVAARAELNQLCRMNLCRTTKSKL